MSYQKIEQFFNSSWYWRMPVFAGIFMVILMISGINQSLFLVINSVLYTPLESIWLYLSIFGEAEVIAILLLPLIGRRSDIIWAVLISLTITIISVELAKDYFALPRPPVILDFDEFHQIGEYYAVDSFPSVHAAAAFSIAAVVILSVQQRWIKIAVFIYACLIGLSQIAIGANWPIDILAGSIAGWLPATVGINLAKNKILQTLIAEKFLIVLLTLISIYIIYNFIYDDIEVVVLKLLILFFCFIIVLPEIRKILTKNNYVKHGKKSRKAKQRKK